MFDWLNEWICYLCVCFIAPEQRFYFFFQQKTAGLFPNAMKQPAALRAKWTKSRWTDRRVCYTSAASPPPDPGLLKLSSALCGWWFSLQLDCSVIKAFLTTRRSSILACHLFYPCILYTFVTSALSKFVLCGCVWVRESPLPSTWFVGFQKCACPREKKQKTSCWLAHSACFSQWDHITTRKFHR